MDVGRYIKTEDEIKIMREGGKILAQILENLKKEIKPGLNTMDLEKSFLQLCEKYNVGPSCKGYAPGGLSSFPTGLCVSVNNESVHCYPTFSKILQEGDIVSVDTVIKYKNLHVDASFASKVGKVTENKETLLKVSEEALYDTISKVKSGVKIGKLSETMEKKAKSYGFNVLEDYAGHGIGYDMHEYPQIPCSGSRFEGPKLREGMTICIESLVCEGDNSVLNITDWETKMADGKNFCQFEHTVLVTKEGYEILTTL